MRTFRFHDEVTVPRPQAEVFEFFANALNLETITPPWLKFHVTTKQPIEMREGVEIDYKLKIRGFPVRWRSKITVWEPPHRFVDEQLRGPYRLWIHDHTFRTVGEGTVCADNVEYAPLGGWIVNKLLVERDVNMIFSYRSARLKEIFAGRVYPRLMGGKAGLRTA